MLADKLRVRHVGARRAVPRLELDPRHQPRPDQREELGKALVLRGLGDGVVKGKIRLPGRGAGLEALGHLALRLDDLVDLRARAPGRGQRGGADLEGGPQFEKLDHARQPLGIEIGERTLFRLRRVEHVDPRALARLDQPLRAQLRKNLAHHGAADGMPARELRFARQTVTRREIALGDGLPQLVGDHRDTGAGGKRLCDRGRHVG